VHALDFTLIVAGIAFAAGLLGSLTGLGGGAILISVLVLFMGVDMRFAIGASLICVIATSSGSAAAFVREGFTNVRLGILLELGTVTGAIVGAALARFIPIQGLMIIFSLVLLWSAYSTVMRPKSLAQTSESDALALKLKLPSYYPSGGKMTAYGVRNVPAGVAIMFSAGVLSALVGLGSGVVKVLAMDRAMRIPFKVSTTTSNFMIGVTAAASAGVYLHRGQIDPVLCLPVVLGALAGSLFGARVLPKAKTQTLRVIFAVIVAIMALQMLYKAIMGPGGGA